MQGMLQSEALGHFYKDLKDPNVESVYAVYHRRFSTNTNPKWPLAQPMRVLGHNGEHACCVVHAEPEYEDTGFVCGLQACHCTCMSTCWRCLHLQRATSCCRLSQAGLCHGC